MNRSLEAPSWADGTLVPCGFTPRGCPSPQATECVEQVHGDRVHVVVRPAAPAQGDGLWTAIRGLPLAVRVADCVPILLWDPEVPAVAAVHAGWRGTALDIAGAAVRIGVDRLGVAPPRLRAALGPSIGACCFEVGDEVVQALRALGLQDRQFDRRVGPRGRPHVDLRAANRALLTRAGLSGEHVEEVGGCTACHPTRYESWRRDGRAAGRMRGVIALAVLTLALLCGCGGGPAPLGEEAIIEQTGRAQQALADGDGKGAEALLRPLLDQRPGDAWLRASLGRALHRQGRYREAAVQSRLAMTADPTMWEAAYNLACHHAALGERDEAITWLQAALATGRVRPEDALVDPDLAPLEEDHRFAFFASTGVLSREEEDAIALLHQPSVRVGEQATLSLVSIALNRPLMEERRPVEVRLLGTPPSIRPVSRRETFSVGSEGGREYHQRTFHYTFEPVEPGLVPLGPFELVRADTGRFTGTVLLEVREGPEPVAASPAPPAEEVARFFAAPTLDDGRLIAAHEARGGQAVEVDAAAAAPPDLPWIEADGVASRHLRFRAISLEELPASVPPREDGVFRSILVRRATEGWSHLLEIRPAD